PLRGAWRGRRPARPRRFCSVRLKGRDALPPGMSAPPRIDTAEGKAKMAAPINQLHQMRLLTGRYGSDWFRKRVWRPRMSQWPFLSGYWISHARKAARAGHWGAARRSYENF